MPSSNKNIRKRITWHALQNMKTSAEPIAMLTAYDATQAAIADAAGCDMILVGDSLGMVIHGQANTLAVTLDHIAYHTQAVAKGLSHALLVADMPFATYATPENAYTNAAHLIQSGAAGVKLEGAASHVLDSITYLSTREIPVCAHLGLTPQSFHRLGGFHVQARDAQAAETLKQDAIAVQKAGASMLVLECVPHALASMITQSLDIPTIGIGAGAQCDGQVLVFYDALGMSLHRLPRFVRNFMPQPTITEALSAYVQAVKQRAFPSEQESY